MKMQLVSPIVPLGFLALLAGCSGPLETPRSRTDTSPAPTAGVPQVVATGEIAEHREAPANVWPKSVMGDSNSKSATVAEPAPEPKNEPRKEEEEPGQVVRGQEEKEIPPENPPPIPDSFKPLNPQKNLFFEKMADGRRRVHILAEVCLREGALEVFLCRQETKEHESILRADLDVRDIHFALIAAGGKPGSTVKFVPEYKPATGSPIKVTVTYYKGDKLLSEPAQRWITDMKTKKDMTHDWVFAGSRFFKDPEMPKKPPYYCANNGEVICIANFADSMMDLPVRSSKEQVDLGFSANTQRIPPLKTKVLVTLEAVQAKK